MLIRNYLFNNDLVNKIHSGNRNFITVSDIKGPAGSSVEFIRFEEKKEKYTWAAPNEIYFIMSADHYVKALINCDKKMKWMTRHSTLKEIITILPPENFIRLNRFYFLNLEHFSHMCESKKRLHFRNHFSITISHRISPFLLHLLKSTYT